MAFLFALAASAAACLATAGEPTPTIVYTAVSSKVGELEARLAQIEAANKKALSDHKAQYESTLQSKRQGNIELALANADIAKQAQVMQERNAGLRKQAQDLQKDTRLWQDDWSAVYLNITTALEVTTATLTTFDDSNAPELQILRDMDKQDEMKNKVNDRASLLSELMSSVQTPPTAPVGFMQTGGGRQNPESLIMALESGIKELTADHDSKEASLMQDYLKLTEAEDKRHDGLMIEQKRLNATLASLSGLHNRLVLATKHLQEVNSQLTKRGQSIRAYAQSLGSRETTSREVPVEAKRATPHTQSNMYIRANEAPEEALATISDQPETAPPSQLMAQTEEVTEQPAANASMEPSPDKSTSTKLPSWLSWWKRH